jgi:type II secretory pathway component GspD/PulD (secretin)
MKPPAIWVWLAMLAISPWTSHAQETGERKRIRVIPRTEALAPDTAQSVASLKTPNNDSVQLNFGPSSDFREVLHLYKIITGRQLIYSGKVEGPCPLVVHERVPRVQAVSLIENALFANGFTLVDLPDRGTLQVGGIGQSPAQFPIPVFTNLNEIPTGERLVRMVFKIRHRSVVELAQMMSRAYPPAPYMAGQGYIADPKAQTLIVTERTTTVREIGKVIQQLDVVDTQRLIRISLIVIGGASLVLIAVLAFPRRRAGGATEVRC